MVKICINKCGGVWHVCSERWRCLDAQQLLVSGPLARASIMLLALLGQCRPWPGPDLSLD